MDNRTSSISGSDTVAAPERQEMSPHSGALDAAPIAAELFGWVGPGVANVADKDSDQSVDIAAAMLKGVLGDASGAEPAAAQGKGVLFEEAVRAFLECRLRELDPSRDWNVER